MNELTPVEQHDIALLDSLAYEARNYAENAAMNMLQLGRVLAQAKPQVDHGDWQDWVEQKVGISMRWAQYCLSGYERYGENQEYAKLGKSKLQIMLALPPGAEDSFMQQNDVEAMSTRELREAVRKAREEAKHEAEMQAQAEIERERKARRAAEARAEALAERPDEISEETAEELRAKDREIERLGCQNKEIMDKRDELQRNNNKLQRQLDEQEQLLQAASDNYKGLQKKLNEANDALQKKEDDDERPPRNDLSLDVFTSAVMRFTGTCSRLPYMRNSFLVMDNDTRSAFDELLQTMEGWCAASRKAIDAIMTDGGIIIE